VPKKIFNWAHRGASGVAIENTLTAFTEAVRLGADGIECDIRESLDGELIIFHDPTLQRLANVSTALAALTCADLKKIPIGEGLFDPPRSGTIPTLSEAVSSVPPSVRWNLEVKTVSAGKIVHFIEQHFIQKHQSHRVILSSFDHSALAEIRVLHPSVEIALCVEREPWGELFRKAHLLNAVSLTVPARRVDQRRVDEIHREGLRIDIYTVNKTEQMAAFIAMGADGLFTNFPDQLCPLQ